MITLTKIVRTCYSCPSQWDAWDDEGNYYYFRFRWGYLRVDKAPAQTDWQSPLALAYGATSNGKCETLYGEQISDGLDGHLGYHELINQLGNTFRFPLEEEEDR